MNGGLATPGSLQAVSSSPPLAASHPVVEVGSLRGAREKQGLGQYAAAWAEALVAIGHRPFHPEAWMQMSDAAAGAGDFAAALKAARRARELVPSWGLARDAVKAFEKRAQGRSSKAGGLGVQWPELPASRRLTRLSLCMIVRNEEKYLAQCLRSVSGLASQIVIVDTGSRDRTCDIAREFGAEVHSFEWVDDFSAARNEALQHARGDWVLVLDADEELLVESSRHLVPLMEDAGHSGYRIPLQDVVRGPSSTIHVPRLFRNAPGIQFTGRIHEDAFPSVGRIGASWGLKVGIGKLGILHHGYTAEATVERDKVHRNHGLLVRALEENPDQLGLMAQLGFELMRLGRAEESLVQYAAALTRAEAASIDSYSREFVEAVLTQYTTFLSRMGRHDTVIEVLTSPFARRHSPTPTLQFLHGLALVNRREFHPACSLLEQARLRRAEATLYSKPLNIEGPMIECALAQACEGLGRWELAEKWYREGIGLDPHDPEVVGSYAGFMSRRGRGQEAVLKLRQYLGSHPDRVDLWVQGVQIALSDPGLRALAAGMVDEGLRASPADRRLKLQRASSLLQNDDALGAWDGFVQVFGNTPDRQYFAAFMLAAIACDKKPLPEVPASIGRELSMEMLKTSQHLSRAGALRTLQLFFDRVGAHKDRLPALIEALGVE